MSRFALALLAGTAALGFMSSVQAADLIIEDNFVDVGVVDLGGNWEGPYIGIFGGYAWGVADMTDPGAGPCSAGDLEGCDVDLTGWTLGLKAGANFYVSQGLLAGVVADVSWSDISGSDIFPAPVDESINTINWQGSVRGLLGFDGGAFLPYLTAGLAIANASHYSDFADPYIDTVSATHVGVTVGAGVAIAASDELSVNVEYRFTNFGAQVYDHETPVAPPEFALTQHLVTVGLNWQF